MSIPQLENMANMPGIDTKLLNQVLKEKIQEAGGAEDATAAANNDSGSDSD